jgi:hypothetical protein
MTQMRKAAIYKLAAAAYEMELDVMGGILSQDEDGRWRVGSLDLSEWLARHAGEDVSIVLGATADERELKSRTCRTCGRDYVDMECPYCRANRIRLRGHS